MPRKTTFAMSESVLFVTTFKLLEDRPRHVTYEMLESVSGVPWAWIKAFAYGRIQDPSVIRVEKLYNALADEPLELPYVV